MELKLDFQDVLMLPKVPARPLTSRAAIDLDLAYKSFHGIPLIVANMPSIGTYEMARILSPRKISTFIYKDTSEEDHLRELARMETTKYVGITTGIQEAEIQRALNVSEKFDIGFINLDTANIYGNFEAVLKAADRIKKLRPRPLLVVGNICTPEVVTTLAETGADILKIGVGSGSACLTRSEVGIGVPQLAAVMDVVEAAKGLPIRLISDGGCVSSGDICKAFGAGAHFVMLGGMVAGCDECTNQIEIDGASYVQFWGLGSRRQFEMQRTSERQYRPNEGRDLLLPRKGSVHELFGQILGAMRSACTYSGCERLEDLVGRAKFIRVTGQLNTSLSHFERPASSLNKSR